MAKAKVKNTTLTKINPSVLRPKPAAVSQHAALDGTRVTTAVNPVHVPPIPPTDSLAFDLDFGDLDKDLEEEEEEEADILKEYYVARVRYILPSTVASVDRSQDNPLLLWRAERGLFLGEFI